MAREIACRDRAKTRSWCAEAGCAARDTREKAGRRRTSEAVQGLDDVLEMHCRCRAEDLMGLRSWNE